MRLFLRPFACASLTSRRTDKSTNSWWSLQTRHSVFSAERNFAGNA